MKQDLLSLSATRSTQRIIRKAGQVRPVLATVRYGQFWHRPGTARPKESPLLLMVPKIAPQSSALSQIRMITCFFRGICPGKNT
jgi:hypothetical protein